jgi:hypothetical protein
MAKTPGSLYRSIICCGLLMASSAHAELLTENGSFITHPGAGAAGGDVSAVQTGLGLSDFGFNASSASSLRISDDFTVNGTGWDIESITLYAYQSPPGLSFSAASLQIWDGQPGSGGASVVWGDTSTNRLATSSPTQIYRAADTSLTNADRQIVQLTLDTNGLSLSSGSYWLDFDISSTNSAQIPPVSIEGQTTTGDAMQQSGGTWQDLQDSGTNTAQGVPFEIHGTRSQATYTGSTAATPVPILSPFGLLVVSFSLFGIGYRVLRRR